MTKQLSIVLTSAFLVLGAMFVVKPGAAVPDQASGMDIAGLTAAAKDLPVQQFPAF